MGAAGVCPHSWEGDLLVCPLLEQQRPVRRSEQEHRERSVEQLLGAVDLRHQVAWRIEEMSMYVSAGFSWEYTGVDERRRASSEREFASSFRLTELIQARLRPPDELGSKLELGQGSDMSFRSEG
jgi:hypothetical protein